MDLNGNLINMCAEETQSNQHYKGEALKLRMEMDRVHWICKRARGKRVLDVGCGAGIRCRLLAQEGFRVTGIDLDEAAIAESEEQLRSASEEVIKRVELIHSSFESAGLGKRRFDTIVLSSTLGQTLFPRKQLELAARHLSRNGRVIVTTRYGASREKELKSIFYIEDLTFLLASYFDGLTVDMRHGHILTTGKARSDAGKQDVPGTAAYGVNLESIAKLARGTALAQERHYLAELDRKINHFQTALDEEKRRHDARQKNLADETARQADACGFKLASNNLEAGISFLGEKVRELQGSMRKLESERDAARSNLLDQERRHHETLLRLNQQYHDWELSLERAVGGVLAAAEVDVEKGGLTARVGALAEAVRSSVQHQRKAEQFQRESEAALRRSEQKRAGHYRELVMQRKEVERLHKHIEALQNSTRYRVGTMLAELRYAPVRLFTWPLRAMGVKRSYTRRRERVGEAAKRQPVETDVKPTPSTDPKLGRHRRVREPTLVPYVRPVALRDLRVAAILDEMSFHCLSPEGDFLAITPNNWPTLLERSPPNLLLVESAWQGNNGSWQYKVGRYAHPDAGGLAELVRWCRSRGIPTVFWNKEDPVHFDKFKDAARLFDHVLTTDERVISSYQELDRSEIQSVGSMTFAAQPILHNPVGGMERANTPCFAGSYYASRHVARRAKMEMLLDVAREFGLVIYDRNWGSEVDEFQFPDRFRPHIQGRLPYDELVDVYKSHKVFLNINSVEGSPTMLSRRVFELLACGTVVISTPSDAIERYFGDAVIQVETEDEAHAALERVLTDDDYCRTLRLQGWRCVMRAHTYEHRFDQVATVCGYTECRTADRTVTIMLPNADLQRAQIILRIAEGQSQPVNVVIGVASSTDMVSIEQLVAGSGLGNRVRVRRQQASGYIAASRELSQYVTTTWVAPVDPGASMALATEHLEDLAHCTRFVHADIIGVPQLRAAEHVYGRCIDPTSCIVRRDVIERHGWRERDHLDSSFREWERRGVRIYQSHAISAISHA